MMLMKRAFYALFLLFILVIGGYFIQSSLEDPVSISNAYIVKEKMELITNDGVDKYSNYHFCFDCDVGPYDENVYALVTVYDKHNNCIKQDNLSYFYSGHHDCLLEGIKGVKKINIKVYKTKGNPLLNLLLGDTLLANKTIKKIVKNHTVSDVRYEVLEVDNSSSSDDSYDSNYSSGSDDSYDSDYSYDSYYYDSDYSSNSYASEEVTGGAYVASKNSDKFHNSYCGHAERIKSDNRIYFSSRQEALNSGYEPCKICNP